MQEHSRNAGTFLMARVHSLWMKEQLPFSSERYLAHSPGVLSFVLIPRRGLHKGGGNFTFQQNFTFNSYHNNLNHNNFHIPQQNDCILSGNTQEH
jgi:hypothetical protein